MLRKTIHHVVLYNLKTGFAETLVLTQRRVRLGHFEANTHPKTLRFEFSSIILEKPKE